MMKNNEHRRNLGLYMVFVVISFVFLFFHSAWTSPFYDYMAGDACNYWVMGTMMKKGMLPYIDFFDHKGPIIFFIEYLGNILGSGTLGIFCIQLLCLSVSLWGIYKTAGLFYSYRKSLIITAVSLVPIFVFYASNLTEEYCLPLLMICTYFSAKYLTSENKSNEHKPAYAFFYGITFTFCAFIRVTNALPLCIMVFIILCDLVTKKRWINILHNAVMFIAGVVAVTVPIIIYFIRINALDEMIYATFIHNVKYVSSNQESIMSWGVSGFIATLCFSISAVVAIIRFMADKGMRRVSVCVFIMGIIGLYFHMINRPFSHYQLVWMPMIILTLCLYSNKKMFRKPFGLFTLLTMECFAGFMLICGVRVVNNDIIMYKKETYRVFKEAALDVSAHIPEKDRDKVIAYEVDSAFYNITDIMPCYKHFILQDFQSASSADTRKETRIEFESLEAEYVVTMKGSEHDLDDVLENYYYIEEENNRLVLWKKK